MKNHFVFVGIFSFFVSYTHIQISDPDPAPAVIFPTILPIRFSGSVNIVPADFLAAFIKTHGFQFTGLEGYLIEDEQEI